MKIDELKRELTTLADEIEPFEGDLNALHRRERRRRIVTTSLAAALVVVVAIATVALVRRGDDSRVHVTGTGAKEVPAADITHIDLIVIPATPTVQKSLDASPLAVHYARMTRGVRVASNGGLASSLRSPLCALESTDGFAVETSKPGPRITTDLVHDLAGSATSYDVSDVLGFDFEVFLKVDASPAQVAAVGRKLASDSDIESFVEISRADAYAIFKHDFADQPGLVEHTKPADLPVSFRIDLKVGSASLEVVMSRYGSLHGVADGVTRGAGVQTFAPLTPSQLIAPTPISACAKL